MLSMEAAAARPIGEQIMSKGGDHEFQFSSAVAVGWSQQLEPAAPVGSWSQLNLPDT